jgi:hypothetical protein
MNVSPEHVEYVPSAKTSNNVDKTNAWEASQITYIPVTKPIIPNINVLITNPRETLPDLWIGLRRSRYVITAE